MPLHAYRLHTVGTFPTEHIFTPEGRSMNTSHGLIIWQTRMCKFSLLDIWLTSVRATPLLLRTWTSENQLCEQFYDNEYCC